MGGTRLSDGRVVVADQVAHGLKMFSPDGQFLREVGGEGRGPGEFENIRGIGRCALGMVVAYDTHWDENRYDENLDLMGTRSAGNDALGGPPPYQSVRNLDGYVLASGWGDVLGQFEAGYYAATAPVVLFQDGEMIHDFGERLSSERIGFLGNNGTPSSSGPHPFGRQTSLALGPSRAYLGSAEDYRVEVYDLTGRRLQDISWQGPDLTLTKAAVARLADSAVESASRSNQPGLRRWYRDLPKLDRYPAYDRLMTDIVGNLWVRYFLGSQTETADWVIFDPDGELIGQVSLPRRATLLEAGRDYVLLSQLDELDVPTVQVYLVVKS